MTTEIKNLDVNVFWSMRSPYCYISLDRCLELQKKYHLNLHLKIVYPIAIKAPYIFDAFRQTKYRLPYQNIDSFRTAFFHGVPMRYPNPDVVLQEADPDSPYGKILPFEKQKHAQLLCRTGVGATELGKGWEYLNEVMRLVWNGQKNPWDKDNYKFVRAAIDAAGIDADKLMADIEANPDKYDQMIDENMDLQEQNDSQHTGVPNFIFRNEPFFGQDRFDYLFFRLRQNGLTMRDEPIPPFVTKPLRWPDGI